MNFVVLSVFALSMVAWSSAGGNYNVEQWYSVQLMLDEEPPMLGAVIDVKSCEYLGNCKGEKHGDADKPGRSDRETNMPQANKEETKESTPDLEDPTYETIPDETKHQVEDNKLPEMDEKAKERKLSMQEILFIVEISHSPIKVALEGSDMWANVHLMNNKRPNESALIQIYGVGSDKKEYVIKEKHGLRARECSKKLIKTEQQMSDLNMYYKEPTKTVNIEQGGTRTREHTWMGVEYDDQNVWLGPLHLLPLSNRSHQEFEDLGILHCRLQKNITISHLAIGPPPPGRYPVDKFFISTIASHAQRGSGHTQYDFIPWEK